jgi:hypothetical protein
MVSEEEKKISMLADEILMLSKEEKGKLVLMLSKEEKGKLIIELRKRGYTYSEIADLLHVNPNQISEAIKKGQGVENQPAMNICAFKMFVEEKKPIDVAIDLKISTEETLKYYREYLHLKAEGQLLDVRDKLGCDLVPFIELFKEMKSQFSLENIKEALRIAGETDKIEAYLAMTEVDMERKVKVVEKLNLVNNQLQTDIPIAEQKLAFVKQEIEAEEKQLEILRLRNQLLMFNGGSQAV